MHLGGIKNIRSSMFLLSLALGVLICQGCAHHLSLPEEARLSAYVIASDDHAPGAGGQQLLPVFITYGYGSRDNRIGRPTVKTGGEAEEVYIDTDQPAVYVMQRTFTTARGAYTNLIFRVHFPKVPYSLIPFNLTAGDNVGLMVVVTLDDLHRPLLVTTVHTCGCYKAFTPTDLLPADALPEGWDIDRRQKVYGEQLPPQLTFKGIEDPRILLHLRPGVHRVMNIEVVPAVQLNSDRYLQIPMKTESAAALERLPADHAATSLYHGQGWRKGYVKGSIKPFEMLFMSLLSLDLFVGSDKIYADPLISDNPFYTSLKPWRRHDSDMWDFPRFLRYWGWRL